MADLYKFLSLSIQPVSEVLLLCAVGAFLAHPAVNIFPSVARDYLNKLVAVAFIPALLFSKLGNAITLERIINWWYLPINIVVVTSIGALLGLIVIKIFSTQKKYRGLTIVCCAAGNVGNLPLVLIYGLCSDESHPFGDEAECIENGVAYVTFGMLMSVFITWTFAYNIMKPDPEELLDLQKGVSVEADTLINPVTDHLGGQGLEPGMENVDSECSLNTRLIITERPKPKETVAHSLVQVVLLQGRKIAALNLKNMITPPTVAALLSVIVGCIPALKGVFFGANALLPTVTNAIDILGSAMIPSMMLILGGNLSLGPQSCDLGVSTIVGITVTRLILLPLIGLVMVPLAGHLSWVPPDNPLFSFVLLLQFGMPSAINIGTMAQLHGFGEIEASVVLFWAYLSCAPALVAFMAIAFSTLL